MSDDRAKRVLLAGATGYIGRAVARMLAALGHSVVGVVRTADAALEDCDQLIAAVTDAAGLARSLEGREFDAVISCIASRNGVPEDAWRVDYEANRNLLRIAHDSGASHFVLLSAICVQKPRLAFQHAKLAFESELAASGIGYSIVRPTAFFKSLSGQVERVQSGKPFMVFGDGTSTACKPIGEEDLAAYIVDCLHLADRRNRILPIGGPGDALTPREQGELLFELTGRQPRFRSVPVSLFTAAAAVLSPLGKVIPAVGAKAELARIGRYYATESMLLWDAEAQRYDPEATPATGTRTLRAHYEQVLREGLAGHEAGEHAVFRQPRDPR